MTQAQIQLLIDQIVTNANYRANQMNPLLTDILTAAYGPMYIDNAPPTVSEDETGGYRPGSVAYDTLSQRFYICKDASAGAADWVLIPADANYEYKSYANPSEGIILGQNTSVFKAYNTDTVVNITCSVDLPANAYAGKVVILYFENQMDQFTINDDTGTPILSGLTIPAGQQYTITYGGLVWEIVGVSNINPATVSGVAVTKGATVIPNTTAINFIGSSVTVAAAGGGGANVTINPITGVDIKSGGIPFLTDAQFINFNGSNLVPAISTTGINLTYVSTILIQKDDAPVTNVFSTIGTFNFKGTIFDTVNLSGSTVNVISNGAKTLTLTGVIAPAVTDDASGGYSRGSVAVNTGTLLRTYICTDNTIGAAQWRRITEDNGYISIVPTAFGIATPNPNIANILFTDAGGLLSTYRVNVPAYAYTGKKLYMTFQSSINQLFVRNNAGIVTFGTSFPISATISTPKLIIFVCVDEGTQTWVRMQ